MVHSVLVEQGCEFWKIKFLKFVNDRDIFRCFECKLHFYLRSAIIYNKSLQTVHVGGASINRVIFFVTIRLPL